MITVKDAEKFAYQTLSVDGLIDFWAGFAVLLTGLGWLKDELFALSICAFPLAWSFWMMSRKFLSGPRLGNVNLAKTKRVQVSRKLMLTVLTGSMFLGIFAFLAFDPDAIGKDLLQDIIPMVPTLILAVMAAIGGWMLAAPRFFFYAVWMAAAGVLGMIYFGHPSAGMMFGAIAPIAGGLVHFVRFLRENPKAEG